ncbi:MAG: peptidylprolyl isomerase [Candidatus Micrarchaeota archaeon]
MVKLNKGDLVRIAFTGRVASTGAVFETTDEELAKSEGIWSTSAHFGPRLVVCGTGTMVAGLEEGVSGMSAGQKSHIKFSADKAFGPKFKELVRVMSEKEFAKQGVQPAPNLIVSIDGIPAVIKSISSGRILLDFNHPLAGEELEYDLELIEVFTDPKEKAQALVSVFNTTATIREENGSLKVDVPAGLAPANAKALSSVLKASLGEQAQISVPGA